ncbi:hypothetical transcript [Echinococcus multilocularis]|uniref:Hypothetical transcript n=1 Tax=Echinococcus multilocularis TaxID=6211 RepID=A0A0S4MM15_ECHMU|nr:hypothetical transcript [Echinococcus multilocularis]
MLLVFIVGRIAAHFFRFLFYGKSPWSSSSFPQLRNSIPSPRSRSRFSLSQNCFSPLVTVLLYTRALICCRFAIFFGARCVSEEGRQIHLKSQGNICTCELCDGERCYVERSCDISTWAEYSHLFTRIDKWSCQTTDLLNHAARLDCKRLPGSAIKSPSRSHKILLIKMAGARFAVCSQRRHRIQARGSIYETYLWLEAGQRDENVAFCFVRGYSYSQPQGTVFGSLFGILLVILGMGLLAYSCFLPRRCKQSPSVADDVDKVPSSPPPLPPPQDFVTVGAGHLPWICTYPPTRLPSQKFIHTRTKISPQRQKWSDKRNSTNSLLSLRPSEVAVADRPNCYAEVDFLHNMVGVHAFTLVATPCSRDAAAIQGRMSRGGKEIGCTRCADPKGIL